MQIASAKSESPMGASNQSAFIGNCLTISHTFFPCSFAEELVICSIPSNNWAIWWFCWRFFTHVEYGECGGYIIGNEYGVLGQNYVAFLQGSVLRYCSSTLDMGVGLCSLVCVEGLWIIKLMIAGFFH